MTFGFVVYCPRKTGCTCRSHRTDRSFALNASFLICQQSISMRQGYGYRRLELHEMQTQLQPPHHPHAEVLCLQSAPDSRPLERSAPSPSATKPRCAASGTSSAKPRHAASGTSSAKPRHAASGTSSAKPRHATSGASSAKPRHAASGTSSAKPRHAASSTSSAAS